MGFGLFQRIRAYAAQGLKDIESKEQDRQTMAVIGWSANMAVLFFILFAFVAAGVMLYRALQQAGEAVKLLQRRIAILGVMFFLTFILRFVYTAPHLTLQPNSSNIQSTQVHLFHSTVCRRMGLPGRIYPRVLPRFSHPHHLPLQPLPLCVLPHERVVDISAVLPIVCNGTQRPAAAAGFAVGHPQTQPHTAGQVHQHGRVEPS